jgi:hypothetical protein
VDASGYLYTIATAGMTFAGLSVLTMILRQMLGGQVTKWDSFVTRTWVELGFMTTFGSILPPLLILFEAPAPMAWRIPSGVMTVILGSLGADISGPSAGGKPDAFAITGGDILADDGHRCAGFGGKCNCCSWWAVGGRLCRGSDRDTDRCRDVVPVRVRVGMTQQSSTSSRNRKS